MYSTGVKRVADGSSRLYFRGFEDVLVPALDLLQRKGPTRYQILRAVDEGGDELLASFGHPNRSAEQGMKDDDHS